MLLNKVLQTHPTAQESPCWLWELERQYAPKKHDFSFFHDADFLVCNYTGYWMKEPLCSSGAKKVGPHITKVYVQLPQNIKRILSRTQLVSCNLLDSFWALPLCSLCLELEAFGNHSEQQCWVLIHCSAFAATGYFFLLAYSMYKPKT